MYIRTAVAAAAEARAEKEKLIKYPLRRKAHIPDPANV